MIRYVYVEKVNDLFPIMVSLHAVPPLGWGCFRKIYSAMLQSSIVPVFDEKLTPTLHIFRLSLM